MNMFWRGVNMVLPEELEDTADLFYWNSCVKAIADGEMSIESIEPNAREQMLEDVNYYKQYGEFFEEDC